MGEKLPAPVAADREQCKRRRYPELPPHVLQDTVDQSAVVAQHHPAIRRLAKSPLQRVALGLHARLEAGERGAPVSQALRGGTTGSKAPAGGGGRGGRGGDREPA